MAPRLPDSDSEAESTPRTGRSAPDSPSTAPTSNRATSKRASPDNDDVTIGDDDSDDEPVVPAGKRATPTRNASLIASKKLSTPIETLEMSSDPSELETTDEEVLKKQAKKKSAARGKGRAIVVSSSDEDAFESESDVDIKSAISTSDDDQEEKVRKLARNLTSSKPSKGKGKAVDGGEVAKRIARKLKGKGKAARAEFQVVIEKKPTIKRSNSSKGKARKVESSSDDDDESDFKHEASSDDDDDGSELDMLASESEMEVDEEEGSDASSSTTKKKSKKAAPAARDKSDKPKIKPRQGHQFSKSEKKAISKMSKFDQSQAYLKANHIELENCWEDLHAIPLTKVEKAIQPDGLTRKLLPFQLEGLNWMVKQEQGPFGGGFLCDEMGMGKTIQTISLILSDWSRSDRKHTLVLAPTVAILQWKNEIAKFTEGIKVLVHHGTNRITTVKEMEKYDIVLTSYAVMESDYRRENKGFTKKGQLMKEDSILHKLKWHRVILDEAHNIKDRASNTAKAAFALKGKFRWCLSGTPLQNRVGELYSLIRFVNVSPHSYYFCKQCDCKSLHWLCNKGPCTECRHSGMQHVCWWNTEILKPIQYGGMHEGEGQRAFKKLASLLERLMLRRTKVERADDLGLPPRVVKVREDYFTEEEEELYLSLFKDVKRKFNTYANEGTVLNNYSNIFTLITRMRQMADHPDLVLKSKTAMPVLHAAEDKPEDIITCRICLDEAEDPVKTQCRHLFCRECIRQYLESALENKPQCPVCNLPVSIDLEQDAIEQDTTGRQGLLGRLDPSKVRTSTKIEALLEELSKTRTEDHTLKTLVFSQFTTMLDLVARRLQIGGFKFVRIAGTMTPTARDNTVRAFSEDPECTVFLISLKAGGVALNLVEANRVIMLDPWWNPAAELQAMDRTHRIGQHRPITVTRLIVANSIESRIVELQKKKENLAASALGDDSSAAGRLTPEDLRFLFSL